MSFTAIIVDSRLRRTGWAISTPHQTLTLSKIFMKEKGGRAKPLIKFSTSLTSRHSPTKPTKRNSNKDKKRINTLDELGIEPRTFRIKAEAGTSHAHVSTPASRGGVTRESMLSERSTN